MYRVKTAAGALVLALAATTAAAQGPPPPVRYDGPPTVEGHDVGVLFNRWVGWVERQKGEVLEAAMADPNHPGSLRQRGQPILEARAFGDQGLVLSASIAVVCPFAEGRFQSDACIVRMREATIPWRADGYGSEDTLADWTRTAFDAAAVVEVLSAAGVASGGDLWRIDLDPAFSRLASPGEVLRQGLRVRTVDAAACPAMEQALQSLEGRALDGTIDLWGIGEDGSISPPRPHAIRSTYTLRYVADDIVTLQGGRALEALISPAFAAGQACLRLAG